MRFATHQDQEGKICSSVDRADDDQESLEFDAVAGVLRGEQTSKGVPEGGDWCALPDEDKDDGNCKPYDEDAAVHQDAPELDDREDSVLKQDATNRVC